MGQNPIARISAGGGEVGSDGGLAGDEAGRDVKLQLRGGEGVKLREGPGGWYIA